MKLEGKVALITGGGTGIGAAVAKRFVDEGAKVVITGRRREMLDEVAMSLPAGSVQVCGGDVCEEGNAERMVEAALALTGRLDILVNNAAIEANKPVVEMDPAVWRQMLEVNLTGPFLMMKAAIPKMIEAGGGSIINVASIAGIVAVPGGPAYCATKAGLIHLTKQVALDYGKKDVRCNVVLPGPVRTSMLEMNVRPLTEVLHTDIDGVFDDDGRQRASRSHRASARDHRAVRLPRQRGFRVHDRVDGGHRWRSDDRRPVRGGRRSTGRRLGLERRGRREQGAVNRIDTWGG